MLYSDSKQQFSESNDGATAITVAAPNCKKDRLAQLHYICDHKSCTISSYDALNAFRAACLK